MIAVPRNDEETHERLEASRFSLRDRHQACQKAGTPIAITMTAKTSEGRTLITWYLLRAARNNNPDKTRLIPHLTESGLCCRNGITPRREADW